jgi:molybdate transport system substrate-binding protein
MKPKVYAKGALVILSKKKYNFKDKIRILQDKNIKKIAIANPKTAPYGKATYEALKNANLYNKVKNKFIFTESISQTVSYIFIGADIGFVAKSSLYSKKLKKLEQNINWIDVDANLYSPIKQGIVILDNAKDNQYAKYFYKFILSNKARIIFKKYGYILP